MITKQLLELKAYFLYIIVAARQPATATMNNLEVLGVTMMRHKVIKEYHKKSVSVFGFDNTI